MNLLRRLFGGGITTSAGPCPTCKKSPCPCARCHGQPREFLASVLELEATDGRCGACGKAVWEWVTELRADELVRCPWCSRWADVKVNFSAVADRDSLDVVVEELRLQCYNEACPHGGSGQFWFYYRSYPENVTTLLDANERVRRMHASQSLLYRVLVKKRLLNFT